MSDAQLLIGVTSSENFCRDAYSLRATYRNEASKFNAFGSIDRLERIMRIKLTLDDYPYLLEAVRKHEIVRQAILVAFFAFGEQKRENNPELKIRHTLRIANKIAFHFGIDAFTPIVKALLHDTREDCDLEDAPLRILFGDAIADSLKIGRLSIPRHAILEQLYPAIDTAALDLPPFEALPNWHQRALRKQKFKDKVQHFMLEVDEQVIKVIDNMDDPWSNLRDFMGGHWKPSPEKIIELGIKFLHRTEHHRGYINKIIPHESLTFGERVVNLEELCTVLNKEFEVIEKGIHYLLLQTPMDRLYGATLKTLEPANLPGCAAK